MTTTRLDTRSEIAACKLNDACYELITGMRVVSRNYLYLTDHANDHARMCSKASVQNPNNTECSRCKQRQNAAREEHKDEGTLAFWKLDFPEHGQRRDYEQYVGHKVHFGTVNLRVPCV